MFVAEKPGSRPPGRRRYVFILKTRLCNFYIVRFFYHACFGASRKAIETSTLDYPVLTDGAEIHGLLSRTSLNSDNIKDKYSEIRYFGRNWWKWIFKGQTLFEIRDGVPGLSKPAIDYETFTSELGDWRSFDDEQSMKRIWRVVEAVSQSGHGAGVIISAEAAEEAIRLGNESIRTDVTELQGELAVQLSRMDGAILLDLQGYIHAFGIIVDGPACAEGDPGRGSRYNCSIRYVRSRKCRAFIFVVSTDGTVDPISPREFEPDCVSGSNSSTSHKTSVQ
jgi:hypothetical protein